MATLEFDVDDFRAQFPGRFPDPPNTDAFIEIFWDAAVCYVSPDTFGALSADCRRDVLNFVTAHLITLSDAAVAGSQPGFVVSGSIDKISVTLQAPPNNSAFQFFLNQTPDGIQAYTLLYIRGTGGTYFGAFNELGSIRRAGGVFTPTGSAAAAGSVASATNCPILTNSLQAPYDFDFGTLTLGQNLTLSILVPTDCVEVTLEVTGEGTGTYTAEFWTGVAVDTGNRVNAYYWDSDARQANSVSSNSAKNQNPTGATLGSGFQLASLALGSTGANPNLLAVTGFNSATEQTLNVNLERVT